MEKEAQSEAIRKGMERARKLGRPIGPPQRVSDAEIEAVIHLPTKDARKIVGLCRSHYQHRRRLIEERKSATSN